ncbi:putative NADPH-quinone reductase [Paenibacillus xylanexedens]|nr:hypothetical protein [Paenibacillus xylanexedens]MCP1422361.1 putative NADPH-quinone reductase [Paenibacillus xylanexedens]
MSGDKAVPLQLAQLLNQHFVEELVAPFVASMNHVGVQALPHYAVYGASFQATDEEINRSAEEYMRYIKQFRDF